MIYDQSHCFVWVFLCFMLSKQINIHALAGITGSCKNITMPSCLVSLVENIYRRMAQFNILQ